MLLAPPDELTTTVLESALAAGWALDPVSIAYRPVGFGSHHWEVLDRGGRRWFLTVDDLESKRQSRDEPLSTTLDRLLASLATACALREHGYAFVVAPVHTQDGPPLTRIGERYAAALYPFVDGRSFEWGEFSTPAHRRATLDLVIAVHTAPPAARRYTMIDDFAVPHRDELEAALRGGAIGNGGKPVGGVGGGGPAGGADGCEPVGGVGGGGPAGGADGCELAGGDHGGGLADGGPGLAGLGPYAVMAARLIAEHETPLRRLLARYDELAAGGRSQPFRAVLTHGEPHPGNTMLAGEKWLLIDWDTALIAPPERDLWGLEPGDGSILDAYAAATGVAPQPSMGELYRIRWTLADIAIEVGRFRRPHTGNADDAQAWDVLRSAVTGIP